MGPPAEVLANRYRLTSVIAGGGMGQVWRGHDTLLDRPVAVKVLQDQFAGDEVFRARFRAEAQHAASLTHPNIAAVFDYGEVPTGPGAAPLAYLVMELVEGESLAGLLAREGRLAPERVVDVVRQAAAGLAAAHAAGLVHRDIKPANLLVTPRGTVKLADFGIARSAASAAVTGTGQIIGTAHYFSPEQAAGGRATPASDVYALGAVAYECLTGRRPFDAESPVQVAVMHIRDEPAPLPAAVPAGVRALVERAMAKHPAARFADGGALHEAAARCAAGLPAGPVRPGVTAVLPVPGPGTRPLPALVTPPLGRRRPPRGLVPLLAGMAAVLLAVVLAVLLLPGGADRPSGGTAPTGTTPAGVEVVVADHLGRPVQDVRAELVARGLRVEVVPVEVTDVPAGAVTAVDPVGTLASGDLVRLSYAVPPLAVPAPVDQGGGERSEDQEKEDDKEKTEEEKREEKREEKEQEAEEEKEGEEADEGGR